MIYYTVRRLNRMVQDERLPPARREWALAELLRRSIAKAKAAKRHLRIVA